MMFPYPQLKLLSHSSDALLLSCDRKYEIYKLRPTIGALELGEDSTEASTTFHLDFGTIVGIGVQEYLKAKDINQAYLKMLTSWEGHLFSEDGLKQKKTFWHALIAVDKFKLFYQTEFRRYSLVSFNGTPAIELGFNIDCADGYNYRGRLDCLLYNEGTNKLVAAEIKTTGSFNIHEAMYKNQGQASGYKLVVDAISKMVSIPLEDSYKVIYWVYQSKAQEWNYFEFKKSNAGLTRWVKNLLTNKQRVEQNIHQDFWPMNGNSCFNYNSPCKYFGICEMQDELLFGKDGSKIEAKDVEADRMSYEFQFRLEDLIQMLMEE